MLISLFFFDKVSTQWTEFHFCMCIKIHLFDRRKVEKFCQAWWWQILRRRIRSAQRTLTINYLHRYCHRTNVVRKINNDKQKSSAHFETVQNIFQLTTIIFIHWISEWLATIHSGAAHFPAKSHAVCDFFFNLHSKLIIDDGSAHL